MNIMFASFESIVNASFQFLFGDTSLTVYRGLALGGTLFFLIVLIGSFFGHTGDSDVDTEFTADDLDGDGTIDSAYVDGGLSVMKLFSIRSVFAFLAMFGWGGVISGEKGFVSFIVALLCGTAAMLSVAFIIRMLLKLQQNGTRSNRSLIGAVGKVYLEIPGGDQHGKVTLSLSDSTREVIAKADTPIARGTDVKVVGLEGDVFRVKKI